MRVLAPNPKYSGTRAGLVFHRGVAQAEELSELTRGWLETRGYLIDTPAPVEVDPVVVESRKPTVRPGKTNA